MFVDLANFWYLNLVLGSFFRISIFSRRFWSEIRRSFIKLQHFSHNTLFVGLLFYIPARAHRHKGRKLRFQEAQRRYMLEYDIIWYDPISDYTILYYIFIYYLVPYGCPLFKFSFFHFVHFPEFSIFQFFIFTCFQI